VKRVLRWIWLFDFLFIMIGALTTWQADFFTAEGRRNMLA